MSIEKRTAPRYFVTTSLPGTLDAMEVEVVDISVKGARLQATREVPIGASVSFSLQCSGANVMIRAAVQWCELAAVALHDEQSDRYLCGIAFDRAVPVIGHLVDDMLAAHNATMIADSRHAERYRVITQLTASFGEVTARLLDVSVGGARIGTLSPLEVGSNRPLRFRITGQAHTPVDVPATAVWSRPSERKGRFESGLRVEGEENWLRAVIDELTLSHSAAVERDSLRRKFDPFGGKAPAGVVTIFR